MKKIIVGTLVVVVILFAAILVVPVVFKDQILTKVKTEINKQVNADVSFENFGLTLFRSFPDLTMSMEDLTVVGKGNFSSDTLLSVPVLNIDIDLAGIMGGSVTITNIMIENPTLSARIDTTGAANYNIAIESNKEGDKTTDTQKDESGSFTMQIDNFEILNADIRYIDDSSKMVANLTEFDFQLEGDFSAAETNLLINSSIRSLTFSMDDIEYLSGIPVVTSINLFADFNTSTYTIKENNFKVDEVLLNLQGDVQVKDESIATNLSFNAPETTFKNLLKLVPEFVLKDLEQVKTSGQLALTGSVKGEYVDENNLPSFELEFMVKDGSIKYPDLPKSVEDINILAGIKHPGNGSADLTVVAIENFAFNLGENPVKSHWEFKTPVSDLHISGMLDGKMDLGSLKDALPIEASDLSGIVTADVEMQGHMSSIEKEDYENFVAKGYFALNSFKYKSEDLPQGMDISTATMDFSPKQINLKSFVAKIGQSDMSVSGYLANYIPYIFKNETVTGKLQFSSNYINANEFLIEEEVGTTDSTSVEEHFPPFLVPDNIDFIVTSSIRKILYDNLSITDLAGQIAIKNQIAKLTNLKMNMLDGSLLMNGQYNTRDTINPFLSSRMVVNTMDVSKVGDAFTSIKKLLPLIKYTEGVISADMTYYSKIGQDMEPDMASIKSKGYFKSPGFIVKNNKALDELAYKLKDKSLKTLKSSKVKINFIVEDSKIVLEPFDVTVNNKPFEVAGSHGLDNKMNYTIKTELAANEIGGDVQKWVSMISDPTKKYPVTLFVKGDMKKPSYSLDLKKATEALMKDATSGDGVKNLLKKLF